jgi:hypothetical protein
VGVLNGIDLLGLTGMRSMCNDIFVLDMRHTMCSTAP